ncbi:Kelch motif family protein [Histomonas meleagridis]|uniref:Kelch motif family protein n=1 Tax=Histomonas meleagridis TaxID=135588 RepID=UPI003559E676|nr:Kelch motif family protein [Histomonas meleagridis]
MGVSFGQKEIDTIHVSDILSRCISTFGYECSDQYISISGEKVDTKSLGKNLIQTAMTSDVTFNCTVADSAIKKINHRNYASNEVITSEEAYINDLGELIDYWSPAIRDSKLFDEQQLKTLFRDIPTIRNTHMVFLKSLKTEVTFATEFGWKFLNFVQFFKLSSTFVSQFKSVDEMIHEKSKNRSFDSKFKEIEANLPAGNGRDFLNYYVTPVQRYPRYMILMREVDKATPLFHPDKPYLAAAMAAVEKVNNEINFSAKRMKQLELMDSLQSSFGGSVTINLPGREVLSMEKIRIMKPKSSSGQIILFNDIIIIASITSRKQYQLLMTFKNNEFRFSNCRPTPESFMVIHDDKEYVIQFEDYEEKLQWMEEYQKVQNNIFSNIKTNHPYVLWRDIEVGDSIPALMNHDGCSMNGSAFFFGGVNISMLRINTLIRYNINANTWSVTTTTIQPRDSHTITSLNGKAYICFGKSKKEYFNDCYVFDELQGGWEQLKVNGQTPIGRMGHSCVTFKNKLIFFGGKNKNEEFLNDVSTLDINTLEYKQIKCNGDLPLPRAYHSASIIDDKMIIIGGRSEKSLCNDIYSLDLNKMIWIKIPLEVGERMYHRTITHGKFLLIIGGMSNKDDEELEVIDTINWKCIKVKQFGNIPYGVSRFACVDIDSKHTMIFGGTDSATRNPIASTYMIDLTHIPFEHNSSQKITFKNTKSTNNNAQEIKQNEITNNNDNEQVEVSNNNNETHDQTIALLEKVFARKVKTTAHSPPPMSQQQAAQIPPRQKSSPQLPVQSSSQQQQQVKQVWNLPKRNTQTQNFNNVKPTNEVKTTKTDTSNVKPKVTSKVETSNVKPKVTSKAESNIRTTPKTDTNVNVPKVDKEIKAITNSNEFNAKQMYSLLNIDASKMIPFEEVAARRKLRRLWAMYIENEELEREIEWYNMILTKKGKLPKGTNLILKIFDDVNQSTKIKFITSDNNVDEIRKIVLDEIQRDAVLYLNTGQTKRKELSQKSLEEAHRSILMNSEPEDMHSIIIVAL